LTTVITGSTRCLAEDKIEGVAADSMAAQTGVVIVRKRTIQR
jgi:hypothetical protein